MTEQEGTAQEGVAPAAEASQKKGPPRLLLIAIAVKLVLIIGIVVAVVVAG